MIKLYAPTNNFYTAIKMIYLTEFPRKAFWDVKAEAAVAKAAKRRKDNAKFILIDSNWFSMCSIIIV